MEQILAKDELRFIWLSLAETMDLWFNWRQGYMFIQVSVSTMNIIQLLTGYEDNSSFVWPKNDLLPKTAGWGQQICSRVKQNCCCLRSQSITVLLYTFIFSKFSYSLFSLTYPLDVFSILVRQDRESEWRLEFVTSISRDLLNQWK